LVRKRKRDANKRAIAPWVIKTVREEELMKEKETRR
jgi:hypothetical protein